VRSGYRRVGLELAGFSLFQIEKPQTYITSVRYRLDGRDGAVAESARRFRCREGIISANRSKEWLWSRMRKLLVGTF